MPLDALGNSVFAKVSPDGALWGPLIEKAFAKLNGNYEAIVGGDPRSSIETLTGAPAEDYTHDDLVSPDDRSAGVWLFDLVTTAIAANGMVSAGTGSSGSSTGMVQGHAYTVIDTFDQSDEVKLYKIRNPWGSENYVGDYSDGDISNWDPEL